MLPHLWWLASPLLPKYEICGTDHLLCLLALYLTFQNCWTSPRSFLLVLVKVFVTVLKGSFHESLETDSSRRACALISCTGCYWFPHLLLRHVHWEGSHLFSNCSHEPSFLLSIKTLLSGGGGLCGRRTAVSLDNSWLFNKILFGAFSPKKLA